MSILPAPHLISLQHPAHPSVCKQIQVSFKCIIHSPSCGMLMLCHCHIKNVKWMYNQWIMIHTLLTETHFTSIIFFLNLHCKGKQWRYWNGNGTGNGNGNDLPPVVLNGQRTDKNVYSRSWDLQTSSKDLVNPNLQRQNIPYFKRVSYLLTYLLLGLCIRPQTFTTEFALLHNNLD